VGLLLREDEVGIAARVAVGARRRPDIGAQEDAAHEQDEAYGIGDKEHGVEGEGERPRARRPGSLWLSYSAIDAASRIVEMVGSNQNGSSRRLLAT
jgi:hypothetical protein